MLQRRNDDDDEDGDDDGVDNFVALAKKKGCKKAVKKGRDVRD